jgi:hypothetical protein
MRPQADIMYFRRTAFLQLRQMKRNDLCDQPKGS